MARLRLATLNLEDFGDRGARSQPLPARIAVLRPLLQRVAADILCLQEVNAQRGPGHDQPGGHHERRFEALDTLLEGTPYRDYARAFAGGFGAAGPADVHNLVTLSRLPIAESRAVRHDHAAPPSWRPATAEPPYAGPLRVEWDRPILHTVHRLADGTMLHVLNLHLRAPLAATIPGQKLDAFRWKSASGWAEGFYLAAMKRLGQAVEARLLVDRLFDADLAARIAVCGDFNAELTETPLRAVRADPADTGSAGLGARALVPLETLAPEGTRYSVLHAGRPVLLDHILASDSLRARVASVEVLSAGLPDEVEAPARGEPVLGSFHAPVVAEFEIG